MHGKKFYQPNLLGALCVGRNVNAELSARCVECVDLQNRLAAPEMPLQKVRSRHTGFFVRPGFFPQKCGSFK